jgi:hypothetical protein
LRLPLLAIRLLLVSSLVEEAFRTISNFSEERDHFQLWSVQLDPDLASKVLACHYAVLFVGSIMVLFR